MTFSGGARDEETFGLERRENITTMLGELIPQRTVQMAPSLLWITLHDTDIAHLGAYSR